MTLDQNTPAMGHVTRSEGITRFGPTPAGETVTLLADGEHTDGQYDFMVTTVEPGPGVAPLHVHHHHDEAFYVLEGELEVRLGEEITLLPEGSFVQMPRGVPHTWRNASSESSQFICIFAPGNHVGVLKDLAELDVSDADPDPAKFAPILDEYDIEMVGPPMGSE